MAKLHELQEKRRNIAVQMRQLNDEIGEKTWTDEQRTKWDSMKHELGGVEAQIEREESLRSTDALFVEEKREEQAKDPVLDAEAKRSQVFDSFLRRGLGELTQEEKQVMAELRAQSVGVNEQGGYTVPKEFQARIVEQMKAYGGIANVSRIITTSDGRNIEWLTADAISEMGELIGENQAATEQDTNFGIANLGSRKLTSKIIRVSGELLQDSAIDIEAYLASRIAERIGRAEAHYLVRGNGTGSPVAQPKGLDVSVTGKTTTAAANAVDWKDINALIHSIDPAYRGAGNTRLAFNDKTFRTLKEMVDANNRPLWLPSITGVAPASILGYQYVIDQGIEDIAKDKKFMFFGDFNRFIVRRVSYMTLKRLVERYAEYDQVGFLAFHRFDCALEDTSAIKALVGK
ncbi:phage major capsid protein [Mannheimia indoligenes]|uniref:Phage major capsid protein n=1 Tax=Mannheimia indoligenes TaxID=3103145 RepID=A0ABU7ZF31_9PAST